MTPSDASRVLETQFSSNWTRCSVVYENVPAKSWTDFGQPSLFDGTNPFIELELSPGFSRPVSIPLGCVRRFANLVIKIYSPRDTGSRPVDDIIGALSELFQYKDFSDLSGQLRCKDLSTTSRNVVLNEWVRTTVVLSFEYDQELG